MYKFVNNFDWYKTFLKLLSEITNVSLDKALYPIMCQINVMYMQKYQCMRDIFVSFSLGCCAKIAISKQLALEIFIFQVGDF